MYHGVIGWLQMTTWLRWCSFCSAVLVLIMLIWGGWLHPIQQQHQQWEQQRLQQGQRYRRQLQLLRAMPALVVLQQQTEQLEATFASSVSRTFSLSELLDASGAVLEYWRPTVRGGELSLRLEWSQFIALVDYLSALQPALLFFTFTLQREEQHLRLVMELTNEN